MPITLETDRLLLRPFEIKDREAVFEFASDPVIQKYTGEKSIEKIEEAEKIITDVWFEDYKKYGYGRLATIYKPDNKLIGFSGLKYLPELDETDLGFRFLSSYWNKGIATESSIEILKHGFKNFNLNQIIAIAMPENIGSNKVLTKVGFKFYKTDQYDGDGGAHNWYKIEKKAYYGKKQ